jgi:hypothetical protein
LGRGLLDAKSQWVTYSVSQRHVLTLMRLLVREPRLLIA